MKNANHLFVVEDGGGDVFYGQVVAQTMSGCKKHGPTNFIFVYKGENFVKVCEKCNRERRLSVLDNMED